MARKPKGKVSRDRGGIGAPITFAFEALRGIAVPVDASELSAVDTGERLHCGLSEFATQQELQSAFLERLYDQK